MNVRVETKQNVIHGHETWTERVWLRNTFVHEQQERQCNSTSESQHQDSS